MKVRVVLYFSGPLLSHLDVCRYENKGRPELRCIGMSFAFTSNRFRTGPIMDSKPTTKLDSNVEERVVSSKNRSLFF
jgi:hypothetical protein